MKVIRKAFEKEITCPKCGALLFYTNKDLKLIGDMESDFNYCLMCPECKNEIEV